jgi:hypothetical protein
VSEVRSLSGAHDVSAGHRPAVTVRAQVLMLEEAVVGVKRGAKRTVAHR